MSVRLDLRSTSAIVVSHPGATHYRVGDDMLASDLLDENGFHQISPDTVVLIPRRGAGPLQVLNALERAIQTRVDSGEVRIPTT